MSHNRRVFVFQMRIVCCRCFLSPRHTARPLRKRSASRFDCWRRQHRRSTAARGNIPNSCVTPPTNGPQLTKPSTAHSFSLRRVCRTRGFKSLDCYIICWPPIDLTFGTGACKHWRPLVATSRCLVDDVRVGARLDPIIVCLGRNPVTSVGFFVAPVT